MSGWTLYAYGFVAYSGMGLYLAEQSPVAKLYSRRIRLGAALLIGTIWPLLFVLTLWALLRLAVSELLGS